MNLGAGRVVMQDLVSLVGHRRRKHQSRPRGRMPAGKGGGTLHLMGLIGSGGVHAIDISSRCSIWQKNHRRIALHAFLDGRKSALGYMRELLEYIRKMGRGEVATSPDATTRWIAIAMGSHPAAYRRSCREGARRRTPRDDS
jgi:2,3-bisphosphoglycerate-independent phosphoglycerate mutase